MDLNDAIKTYVTRRKKKASLEGFLRQGVEVENLVVTWFEIYSAYHVAKTQLNRKFRQVYKEVHRKSCKNNINLDLEPLYLQAVAKKTITNNSTQLLAEGLSSTTDSLRIRLKVTDPSSLSTSAATSSSPTFEVISTNTATSSSPSTSIATDIPASSPSTSSPTVATASSMSTIEIRYKEYIDYCKNKSKKYGFDLQTEIQRVLACKNIILLKKHQLNHDLFRDVDVEEHAKSIKDSIMLDAVKVSSDTYIKLVMTLRGVNQKTTRRNLTIQLNELYSAASEEDGKIISVFVNLVSKLPNFERLDSIGELELITTYVDPILTPLFHEPESHKHFIWSNKQDENTKNLRPDGAVISIPDKSTNVTLGYCEVKPLNSDSDTELAFVDLVRLATFAKDLSKRKENRKSLTVQVIGYNVIIYFIEESFPDVFTMTEVLSLNIPKSICELSGLVAEVDNLKRICNAVNSQCESQYKHSRPLIITGVDNVAINPKRRKARAPSFSLL